MEFISELQTKITNTQGPILLGGDFNLVRRVAKKSFGNVEVRFIYAFNNMIDTTQLRELERSGSRYTWTHNQIPLIMYVLDRVLVNNSWDDKFNLAHVHTNPRLGPDHNPLIVDTGGASRYINITISDLKCWLPRARRFCRVGKGKMARAVQATAT